MKGFSLNEDSKSKQTLSELRDILQIAEDSPYTSKEAKKIIESLRLGVPPKRGALYLTVGRKSLIEKVSQDFDRVANKGSRFLFLKGKFGAGKTHLLRVLQEYAHQKSFTSSLIELSIRECPLYDLGLVYRKIVQNLQITGFSNGSALESILSNWAEQIRVISNFDRDNAIRQLSNLDKNFCAALSVYYSNKLSENPYKCIKVLEWMLGEKLTKNELRELGIKENISDHNALSMLGNFSQMLKYIGQHGIAIFFDEADRTISFESNTNKLTAIRNLNILMQSSKSFPHSYFIYSTPPELFIQKDFMMNVHVDKRNYIEVKELEPEHLEKLAIKIRDIHLCAYNWENISRVRNSKLMEVVAIILRGGVLPVRSFVKNIIEVMDYAQQNPKLALNEIKQ